MRTALIKIGRWALAAMLLFLSLALAGALLHLPAHFDARADVIPAAIGFVAGTLLFTLVTRLSAVYVFGHELTHWLTAKVFRRRTGAFRVGLHGGSVQVERPNIWITLSPYFVPFYTLVWTGCWGVGSAIFGGVPAHVAAIAAAGAGVTYAYHVVLTAYTLQRQQTDLTHYGAALSLGLVAFCNLTLLYAVLVVAGSAWASALPLLSRQLSWQLALFSRITAL